MAEQCWELLLCGCALPHVQGSDDGFVSTFGADANVCTIKVFLTVYITW